MHLELRQCMDATLPWLDCYREETFRNIDIENMDFQNMNLQNMDLTQKLDL